MKVILSTRNMRKLKEIRAIFAGSKIELFTLDQAGIKGQAIEDGGTLESNAFKKAWYAHERCAREYWAMADDTGLFINALSGEPGVHSARWGSENYSTQMRTGYCLGQMAGIKDRAALFNTQVALILPNADRRFFNGAITGNLLEVPRVEPTAQMPYSCLFVPDGHTKCLAEMTIEEENEISHRGKAFRQVRAFLEQYA